MEVLKNYINGSWIESKEKETIDVINPANQEVLAKVPYGKGNVADMDDAVAAASERLGLSVLRQENKGDGHFEVGGSQRAS